MLKAVTLVCAAVLVVSLGGKAQSGQFEKPSKWAIDNAMIGPDSPIEVPAGGSYQAQAYVLAPRWISFPAQSRRHLVD